MNRNLKGTLVAINSIMLLLSIYWYTEKNETEPIISFFGQVIALLVLLFEKKVSNIKTRKIYDNSAVDIDAASGDNVDTSDVKNSKVKIKTGNK